MTRFSMPVRFSSTAAYWPASPIWARSAGASATTSRPITLASPASGGSSVVRTRTAVVLPAPLGLEVDAVEGADVPVGLDEPADGDRGRVRSSFDDAAPSGQAMGWFVVG